MLDRLSEINVFKYLDSIVVVGAYFLLLLGTWILFSDNIIWLFKRNRHKFKVKLNNDHKEGLIADFRKHIRLVLYIVYNSRSLSMYYTFIIISVMLFFLSFLTLSRHSSHLFSLLFSTCAACLPYLRLRLKLRNIRVEGSYEAEGLISELINQYKINYLNMIEAIDKSIDFLDDYPYTKKMLFRLSARIKEYRTDEELQDILQEFTYSLDTQWGIMLSNNLYLAISDGTVVTAALEDILIDLRDTKSDAEIAKRLNNEGFTMVKYLSPLLYLASVYAAINYFGFTITKFKEYQLNTQIGFKFFTYIVAITIINFSIILYLRKQKFDF